MHNLATLFKPLNTAGFAWLWSGQTVSRLGDSLYRIALSWWVLEKTGSAAAMGTVLIFSFTPMLLFLLVGGVVVDRLPRLRVMMTADLFSGAVVTSVALLSWGQRLEVWHVYIASILLGFVEAFFFPAYSALVPDVAPREVLPGANSLTSLSQQLTGIVGPSLGAVVIAMGGTAMAFTLDAVSFFVAAACLLPVTRLPGLGAVRSQASAAGERQPARGALRQGFADLGEGLRVVTASPWLWITILIFGLVNITASGPRSVALPFLVNDDLQAEVSVLGLFQSMASVGFVAGALWMGRLARIRRRGLQAYLGTMLTGLALMAFGLPLPIPVLALASLLNGVFISVFQLIWVNTLQELVPRQLLGRVSSIDALGSFVLLPVGFGLTGWATEWLGAPPVFLLGGALTAILALLGLAHPAIRRLD